MGEVGTVMVWVPGQPQEKERARVAIVNGAPRVYTPATTTKYEAFVRLLALRAMLAAGWREPTKDDRFALRVELYFESLRLPDMDNVLKALQDGLQPAPTKRVKIPAHLRGFARPAPPPRGPGIILDDKHIVSLRVDRWVRSATPGARLFLKRDVERFYGDLI